MPRQKSTRLEDDNKIKNSRQLAILNKALPFWHNMAGGEKVFNQMNNQSPVKREIRLLYALRRQYDGQPEDLDLERNELTHPEQLPIQLENEDEAS